MPKFAVDGLVEASARVLEAAGSPADIAGQLARWLGNANLSGHPSHGFQRVAEYTRHVHDRGWDPAARPEVVSETATIVLIDGHQGFGHFAAELLTRRVAAMAQESGVAMGGIVHGTHIGRLGEWSELAADLGVMFLMCTGWTGSGQAAPFGGAEGRLGTNPLTFASPAADGDRMMLDFATTASAEGKVRVYRDSGQPLPPGWILDKHGQPSTNARDLYDGGLMLPFGAHKGSALSIMISILGGNLVGAAAGPEGRAAGTLAIAMDPGAFGDGAAVLAGVGENLQRIRETRPIEGFGEVQVPGDMERRSREALAGAEIELPEPTWTAFLDAAASVGLDRATIAQVAQPRNV